MSKFALGILGAWNAFTKSVSETVQEFTGIGKGKWEDLAGDYTLAKKHLDTLKLQGKQTGPLETKVTEIDNKVTKGHYSDACDLLKEVQTDLGNLDPRGDFEIKYHSLLPKINTVKDLDKLIPAVLKAAQTTVGNLHKGVTDKVDLGDYPAAKSLLPAFENVLNPTHVSAVALLEARKEVLDVYRPNVGRLKMAMEVVKAKDPRLATEIGAFVTAVKAFSDELSLHKYVEARPLLPAVVSAINDLLGANARLLVTGATTPAKALAAIEQIEPEELKKLTSEQQVGLLAKLREGKDEDEFGNDPALVKARSKVYLNMTMNPRYVEKDKEKRDNVVRALKGDPKITEAKTNWNDPVKMTLVKKKEFIEYVLLKQSTALQPPPAPPPVFDFMDKGRKPNGSIDLGGYTPPPPGDIKINTNVDANFDDFDDVLETILHENTHNYQEYLIQGYKDNTLPVEISGDPELMKQIAMFHENGIGYVPNDPVGYAGTYKKQPLEEHAFDSGHDLMLQITS